jgi:hypothetical protein
MPAEVVQSRDELRAVLARPGRAAGGPRLVDARIDPACYPAVLAATRG